MGRLGKIGDVLELVDEHPEHGAKERDTIRPSEARPPHPCPAQTPAAPQGKLVVGRRLVTALRARRSSAAR